VAISEEVAFCSQSYFGLVFRQLVGMSPLEYRRRARANGGADVPHCHTGTPLPTLAASK
jgi:AraC-like DNA-binding protein